MKTSIALLAVGASITMAQQLSDLPPCGQTCITNMLGLGPSLGCKAGDTVCYCSEPNFGYGVRDCANEACPTGDAATVIAYGEAYCKALLASASVSGGSALTILSSAAAAASGSAASVSATATGSGAAGSVTAITTVPLVATISGSPVTTGFSTVFSSLGAAASSGASSALSSALSDASSAASAASSGASSFASSAASAASSAASSAESALSSLTASLASGASSAASAATATSTGGAPMMTAGSILGAAGMAALMFI